MLLFLCLLSALASYYLPWVQNSSAGLSANALDLAEFVGLAPAVRNTAIPMFGPLLLRSLLVLLGILFVIEARYRHHTQLIMRLIGFALMLTLLPPLEFFKNLGQGALQDPNYMQLLFLSVVGLIAWFVTGFAIRRKVRWRVITSLIAIAMLGLAVWGCANTLDVVRDLRMPAALGAGLPLWTTSLITYILIIINRRYRSG